MNPTLHQLTESDIPGALELARAARWNQLEQDWRNVMAFEPTGCFGISIEGRLAASTTTTCFGTELAWIGMVLTHPDFRGRGYARRLMEHALEYLAERGIAWAKLDATDMGYPLYANLGFRDEVVVQRWRREPQGNFQPKVDPYHDMLEMDYAAFGTDRTRLLELLRPMGAVSSAGDAYAMGRPGFTAAYFGPCVSRTAAAVPPLLEWFLARHPHQPAFWDILESNPAAVEIARTYGFAPVRKLMRMARAMKPQAPPVTHDDKLVFGLAGFEYG